MKKRVKMKAWLFVGNKPGAPWMVPYASNYDLRMVPNKHEAGWVRVLVTEIPPKAKAKKARRKEKR